MTEESDARIERLEKDSQESRAQIAEMIELIRTLIKDKRQALSSGPQNETAQHDQRREEYVYSVGYTLLYASNVQMVQAPPMQQAGGFPYGYVPLPAWVNEVRQNSGENTTDSITILNLDNLKEQEKIRKESSEQFENNEAQWKLELIEERLKAIERSDVYGMVDTYKMSLVPDLVLLRCQLLISTMVLNAPPPTYTCIVEKWRDTQAITNY